MEQMPQMADFVYKFYAQKMVQYQEKKRVSNLTLREFYLWKRFGFF